MKYKIGDNMATPSTYHLECPACEEETAHKLLKGTVSDKGGDFTIDGVVKCKVCGHTRHKLIREKGAIDVPVIISWKEESKRTQVSFLPEEWIHVGEDILVEDSRAKITSLELDGRRGDSAKAEDIKTIWTKKYDKVRVMVSLHKGNSTLSKVLEVPPDEEFFVNNELQVGKYTAVIHRIKTDKGILKKGRAEAEEITRVFATVIDDNHFF